jgi:hypothetical protein
MALLLRSFSPGAAFVVGWLVCACGSSAGGALFGDVGEQRCGSSTLCNPSGSGGRSGDADGGGVAGLPVSNETGGAGGQESSGGAAGVGGSSNTGGDTGAGGLGGRDTGGASASGGADAGARGGAAGSGTIMCPAGNYHAVLTGPYRSGGGSNDIGATIDFSVTDSGAVEGTFMGPGKAMATLTGSVDCATRALSATIDDGTYGAGITLVRFSGTFDGMYDPIGAAFSGRWSITESNNPSGGGTGVWSTS